MRTLQVDVFAYLDYRAFLRDAYVDLKRRQRGFSYRWFARQAGVSSPSFLKLVMDGKRNLSANTQRRFASALNLCTDETSFFVDLVAFNQATSPEDKNQYFERIGTYSKHRTIRSLERSQFECLSRWYYPAVHELVACRGFREEPDWIGQQLVPAISAADARKAIDVLLTVGLLVRNPDGTLQQGEGSLSTGPEVRSLAVGNFHREMMRRAAAAIDLVPHEDRDISGVTVSLSAEAFRMFKQKIIALRAELLNVSANDPDPTRVVQFNFQLFPLAQVDPEEPGS